MSRAGSLGRFAVLATAFVFKLPAGTVELIRDRWGVPHIYAQTEADGFFGAGWAAAEDRILQMDLFRRRARGRLAEVFGAAWVDSDRKFRIVGVGRYCDETAAALPQPLREYFRAYAAGVNAWVARHPETVARRFSRLGILPAMWTEGDSICAWMGVVEVFDRLFDPNAVALYRQFRQRAAEIGEQAALAEPGMMIDDAAAVVPESEMAKDAEVYAKLKAVSPTPGFWRRSLPDDQLRFSHAWAVAGTRSVTGKPLLESDPQVAVSNPPLWYEFHLSAGRFDVRGIAVAGSPAMLIGFNRHLAWGGSALGAGSGVTFIERLSADGTAYLYRGEAAPIERRTEFIEVRGGTTVVEEALRTRHGFAFNALANLTAQGELYVSHQTQIETRRTSLAALLGMMAARNWPEFRAAMRDYYSPGLHVVYADTAGNLAYQTLVHVPRTRRTPRMALEGWTGEDEVTGRIPFEELPYLFNPDTPFISHANNLPVGSWYPYDLGIGTGGTGHSARSLRLVELLTGNHRYSVQSFESEVHRDDVHAAVAALFPIARRLAERDGAADVNLRTLLDALKDWDLRYQAGRPSYPAAMALAEALLPPYRRSRLGARLGGGEGGITHLARLLKKQFGDGTAGLPSEPDVISYLRDWLENAAETLARSGRSRMVEIHRMPYQQNGPLQLPALDEGLELVSPPLACGQVGTIWSQLGNSYTQIVDLADPDNSRAVLPPGISEDPDSPFYADQMDLWVRGATRPAPLSRAAVELLAISRITVQSEPYQVNDVRIFSADGTGTGLAAAWVQRVRADGTQAYEPVARFDAGSGRWEAVPIDLGAEGDHVYLLLFGTGIRQAGGAGHVRAYVGEIATTVTYAGPQGVYAELDQVNLLLPRSLAGRGWTEVVLIAGGREANRVGVEFR